jgi:hypothetical protein
LRDEPSELSHPTAFIEHLWFMCHSTSLPSGDVRNIPGLGTECTLGLGIAKDGTLGTGELRVALLGKLDPQEGQKVWV